MSEQCLVGVVSTGNSMAAWIWVGLQIVSGRSSVTLPLVQIH